MLEDLNSQYYVLDPLGSDELREIENELGHPIPEPLKSVLAKVGFLQNAIAGDWPQSKDEFLSMQDYIPAGYTAFLADGAGNYYVMTDSGALAFWDHEMDEVQNLEQELSDFLKGLLREPEPSGKLVWKVQLAFEADNDSAILDLLEKQLSVKKTGDWAFKDKSPAGVSTYHLPVVTDSGAAIVSKQSYKGWESNNYYYNLAIQITDIPKHKQLFATLEHDNHVGFKLIDYGILPVTLEDQR